jgi:hypothetical protein
MRFSCCSSWLIETALEVVLMHVFEHVEQVEVQEENEVEFSDLDQPDNSRNGKPFGLVVSVLHWRNTSKRRFWRVASSFGFRLLLVMLLGLSNTLSFSILKSFNTALFPLTLSSSSTASNPVHDGIACITDTALSPDSRYIAVLGYYHCLQKGYELGLVNLYDAHSRSLVNQVSPDNVIESALDRSSQPVNRQFGEHPPPDLRAQTVTPLICYWHVIWSPDGQRLALTFEIAARWLPVQGVVLITLQNWEMQVLLPNHVWA